MPSSEAFRHAWPLLLVTLVNKVASLALSLLPAMLVAREVGASAAAVAMLVARGSAVIGTLLGGVAADGFGLRATLVASFTLAALGVAAMIPEGPLEVLVLGAATAQLGMAMFPGASRMMLAATVPLGHQREALGWLRSTTNFGLVISFTLGWLLGGRWIGLLLLLDVVASLAAAGLASRILPSATVPPSADGTTGGERHWPAFAWMTAIVTAWNVTYEAFLTSSSAGLRATLGEDGVAWYAAVMVLNTVLCSLLGVAAARWIDSPRASVPFGFSLLAVGAAVAVSVPGQPWVVALGMALVTAGELAFAATSQFVWMALVPPGPRRGATFSVAMTCAFGARAFGGALAFTFVVGADHPALAMAALAAPGLLAAVAAGPVWRSFEAVGAVR